MHSLHYVHMSNVHRCIFIIFNSEYTTILSSGKRKKWSLEYNRLKATDGSYTVRVLSEELAYNKSFQHYRMLVIDRPLVEGTQKRRKTVVMEDLLTPKRTVKEQLELLANFQKHSEVSLDYFIIIIIVFFRLSMRLISVFKCFVRTIWFLRDSSVTQLVGLRILLNKLIL